MPPSKMSTIEFKQKVFDKLGIKVEILSEYNGGTESIKILYHCEKHGDIFKTLNAKNIFSKQFQPCKQCDLERKSISGRNKLMSKVDQYKRLTQYVESKGGKVITLKWTTAKDLYEIHCGNPEHPSFKSSADSLLNKPQWCPYCCGRKGNFEEEISEIIKNKNGTLLDSYTNTNTHVKVRCNLHNYEWDIMPLNIKKGRWCPICSLPYSEKVVYDYLVNNNYKIVVQYTFEDLKSDKEELLKFDFAILSKTNKLLGLLEVDDSEHRFNTKQERRLKARERDRMKDEYCKINNIPLFRLKYNSNSKLFLDYDWYFDYINENLKNYIISLIDKSPIYECANQRGVLL